MVAFDYFHADLITARSPFMRYARAMVRAVGEPFSFGMASTPPSRTYVAAFLASCGLVMEEHRNFGPETERQPAMAGFTSAVVGPAVALNKPEGGTK